jgi:hypothetical protein
MNVFTLREVAQIMQRRLLAQGIDREITEQVVRIAWKKGMIPAKRTKLGILIEEDTLARLRVKIVGGMDGLRAPVFYTVPANYDDALTVDEVHTGITAMQRRNGEEPWVRNTTRYHLREHGQNPTRGVGGFVDAYQLRRNWMLPVWAVKDADGKVIAWEARWKDGSRKRIAA